MLVSELLRLRRDSVLIALLCCSSPPSLLSSTERVRTQLVPVVWEAWVAHHLHQATKRNKAGIVESA